MWIGLAGDGRSKFYAQVVNDPSIRLLATLPFASSCEAVSCQPRAPQVSSRYDDLRAFSHVARVAKISDVRESIACPLKQNEIRRRPRGVARIAHEEAGQEHGRTIPLTVVAAKGRQTDPRR